MPKPAVITTEHLLLVHRVAQLDELWSDEEGAPSYATVLRDALNRLITQHPQASPRTFQRIIAFSISLSRQVEEGDAHGLTLSLPAEKD